LICNLFKAKEIIRFKQGGWALAFALALQTPQGFAQEAPSLYGLVPPSAGDGIALKLSPPPYIPPIDLTAPSSDVWSSIRNGFAIPDLNNNEVQEQERLLMKNPLMVNTMLVRSRPFIYFIANECAKRNLPAELALLPFVESQFNPNARSPASAEGLWQFIPSTGRQFELKTNRYVDERRDVLASTRAALDYLSYLYDMLGDWHLALASYNWGEGSVLKAIKKTESRGKDPVFSNLTLPNETRQYVPKLQALKNLINDPERFNITLPDIPNKPYFTEIQHNGDLDLREIARAADIDLESIKKLNSSANNAVMYASQGNTTLLVPVFHEDKVKETLENYEGLKLPPPASITRLSAQSNTKQYTVRNGDTLIEIAQRFQTSVETLIRLNGFSRKTRLKPGMSLRVISPEPKAKRLK
jgi:membrane-bound lytic murein transglycosylase D